MPIRPSSFAPRTAFTHVTRRAAVALAVAAALIPSVGRAQDRSNAADIARIRAEGTERSQVMEIASWLTDVHGPRLTNSPQSRAAGEFAKGKLQEWGMANVHYEWFPFGRGWANERAVGQVTAPAAYPVPVFPGAWTAGTDGPVTGEVVVAPLGGSASDEDYARWRGKLRGKIVLASALPTVTPLFAPPATRYTADRLDQLAAARIIPAGGGNAAPARGRAAGARPGAAAAPASGMTPAQRLARFWIEEGVTALVVPGSSRGNSGSVSNAPTGNRQPNAAAAVPQVAVPAEHYGRMYRQVEKGVPVRMEIDVRNRFYDEDLNSYNLIAEIPGTDPTLGAEVVMIGSHFDSWHGATGATDNGGPSATMLEVMRILKASGVPLRRTVRIGLWTGEEQGLIGSNHHVATNYWNRETSSPKPGHEKVSAYFNLDNGGGAIRGIYAQANEAAMPIFSEWMRHVDTDSISVRHVTVNSTGSTDHVAFDRAGIPGFQFIQDPLEYGTRTHHSSQDFYERLVPADMRHNAVVIATFAYLAANRDELLPRKPVQ